MTLEESRSNSPRRRPKSSSSRSLIADLPCLASGDRAEDETQSRFQSSRTWQSKAVNGVAKPKLSKIGLFQQCSQCFMEALSTQLENAVFDAGEEILKEGDVGHCMFLLNFGEVDVVVKDTTIATLGSGALFGEMAVISKNREAAKRTATIKAKTYCHCWTIDRPSLLRLLSVYPKDEGIISAEADRRYADLVKRGIVGPAEKRDCYRQPIMGRVRNKGKAKIGEDAPRRSVTANRYFSHESMSARRTFEGPLRHTYESGQDVTGLEQSASHSLKDVRSKAYSSRHAFFKEDDSEELVTGRHTSCESAAVNKLCKMVSEENVARRSFKTTARQLVEADSSEQIAGWANIGQHVPKRLIPLSRGIFSNSDGDRGEISRLVFSSEQMGPAFHREQVDDLSALLAGLPLSCDTSLPA